MLNFMRALFGRNASRPNPENDEQDEPFPSPPLVISIKGLPDFPITRYLHHHEDFPLLKWVEIESWVADAESPALQASAWQAMERAWLLHLREALGPRFRLRETQSAALLSSLDDGVATATLRYIERTLKRVVTLLDGLAQVPPWGKDILIVFDDVESYYMYVSHCYPEAGEFAFSSGMYINAGCAHFVTVKADLRAIEPVIAHELTHACLAHLPLPLWLNEGLAVNTEHRIVGTSDSHLTAHELRRKHLSFWDPQAMQEFWSGESFRRTDDGNMLSYDLAKLIVAHFAKDWEECKQFVLDADAQDAGAASARVNLKTDLGVLVCSLLEKEPSPRWAPDPQAWSVSSPTRKEVNDESCLLIS